jgi:hypothetical protein
MPQVPNIINNITSSQIITEGSISSIPASLLDANFAVLSNNIIYASNYSSLQDAINAVPSTGATVLIDKVYDIGTTSISINKASNMVLWFTGTGQIVYSGTGIALDFCGTNRGDINSCSIVRPNMNAPNGTCLRISGFISCSVYEPFLTGANGIIIAKGNNLVIKGGGNIISSNQSSTPTPNTVGILFDDTSGEDIEYVRIDVHAVLYFDKGIQLASSNYNAWVDDTVITADLEHNNYGIYIYDCSLLELRNCWYEQNHNASICINNTAKDANYISIISNFFNDSSGVPSIDVTNHCGSITVIESHLESCNLGDASVTYLAGSGSTLNQANTNGITINDGSSYNGLALNGSILSIYNRDLFYDVLQFNPPNIAEYNNGTSWVSTSIPTSLFKGAIGGYTTINNGWSGYRLTWTNFALFDPSSYLEALHLYFSTNDHSFNITVQTSPDGTNWTNQFTKNNIVGSPMYFIYKQQYVTTYSHFRIIFTPIWSANNSKSITLYNIRYFATYGYGIPLYTWDENKNVFFNNKVGIQTTSPVGVLSIGGDNAIPFAIQKSTVAVTAPGAGIGMLRWESGTNPGTLKLVAYSGTSTTGTVIVDNVGGGN